VLVERRGAEQLAEHTDDRRDDCGRLAYQRSDRR
jgi:hypothetical protein